MMTGKTDEGAAIAKSIGLSILTGLVGGGPVIVDPKVWSDMTSNILIENNLLFFSAKDQFVCVDTETGSKLWSIFLPEKETAKAFIHFDGDNIVLVNTGSCKNEGKIIKYGKPYIAKYEKSTGNQAFFNELNVKSPINDIQITENGYFLISDETFSHYDINGNEKARLRYDSESAHEKYGNFRFFPDDNGSFSKSYIGDLTNYTPLFSYYQNKSMPMAVTDKGVIIFDDKFNIDNWFMIEQVFCPEVEAASNRLFRNYPYLINNSPDKTLGDIYLIDKQGKNNGALQIKQPISEINDYLFFKNNNTLVLVNKSFL